MFCSDCLLEVCFMVAIFLLYFCLTLFLLPAQRPLVSICLMLNLVQLRGCALSQSNKQMQYSKKKKRKKKFKESGMKRLHSLITGLDIIQIQLLLHLLETEPKGEVLT